MFNTICLPALVKSQHTHHSLGSAGSMIRVGGTAAPVEEEGSTAWAVEEEEEEERPV